MPVFVATAAALAPDHEQALATLEAWGAPGVCLTPGRPAGRHLARAAARFEGRLIFHHACFADPAAPRWNLAATDEELRKRSLAEAAETLRRAAGEGTPFYSLHPGYAISTTLGAAGEARGLAVSPERAIDQLCRSLDPLASLADTLGLPLLLENGATGAALWQAPESIGRTLERLAAPPLGLLLDVGHLLVACHARRWEPEPVVEALKPYTKALAVSRNDGRCDQHQLPIEGGVELALAKQAGGEALPILLEPHGTSREGLAEALALVAAFVTG